MNGRVFSNPVAGFSMTHIKGSHQRVALQEPPRARRGARLYSVQTGLAQTMSKRPGNVV